MKPTFFRNSLDFRKWLDQNHSTAPEIIVGFYKVKSEQSCMTYKEALDSALCYGWIDGVRRKITENSYSNRFTPRRKGSNWSAVNIAKVAILQEKGMMEPCGIEAFEKRAQISEDSIFEFEKYLQKNKKAWNFYQAQSEGYKDYQLKRVYSAKLESTRQSRLKLLLEACKNEVNLWSTENK